MSLEQSEEGESQLNVSITYWLAYVASIVKSNREDEARVQMQS